MSSPTDDVARKRGCRECRRLKLGSPEKLLTSQSLENGLVKTVESAGVFTKGMRSTKNERLVMHETIGKMSARISQLKDAIEHLQSLVSTEPHPLLEEQDDKIVHPIVSTQPKKPVTTSEEDIIKAFGAFSIGDKGETTFHDASVMSEELSSFQWFQRGIGPRSSVQITSPAHSTLAPNILLLSALFPFPNEAVSATVEEFLSFIPPYSRAQFLVQSYFDNGAWSVDPVHKEDFLAQVLNETYPNEEPSIAKIASDRLSCLFMVFAVGAFFDFEQPLVPSEAENYYILARAALCVQPIYDYPTVYAIQSMTLMMWFQTLAGHRTHAYRPLLWGVLHAACELMSLNRDPKRLGITGVEADVRRVAFWELKSIEHWQAFASGRPAIASVVEDCVQPYEEAYIDPNAPEASAVVWLGWKQHFTDTVNTVADQAFRSKDVTYSRILALDKQLRHHYTPTALRWPSTKGAVYQKLGRNRLTGMQCLARSVLQESALLHLHRWFFMQAVREKPFDPLEHPYSFSLTMGTLVVSAPTIPLAHPAMLEFEKACTLFTNTSSTSVQPDNAAHILLDLLQVAKQAREKGVPQTSTPDSMSGMEDNTYRSSQSPVSVSAFNAWPNGSSPSVSNTSTPAPPPPPVRKVKRETEASEVRQNLQAWWDSASREF
ncbi:hypothetical protein Clacol_006601 [Clathrus columnatus]|uniref:Xylanolytic transcriptional activator regulatory domain-containing protein n=1 Tax=Clathrus columnatus TaxID=1419009 RepID=A0AAV5ADA0_9AGAM|nr:hypothetical protein Clacol_006601 [Clathrus columnatus]